MLEVEPQLIERYVSTGQMRIIVRPLLQTGEDSLLAAHAAACAGEQQQYFTMRSALYANQGALYTAPDMTQALQQVAQGIGIDTNKFATCMQQETYRLALISQYTLAREDGILARPVFEINGQRLIGAQPFAQFGPIIDALLKQ